MSNNIIERGDVIENFNPVVERSSPPTLAPTGFAPPTERPFGAQAVANPRDESEVLKKLRVLAAAAGDDWFYRFPVKKKVKDEKTGREEWVIEHIEGPSIKCANNVSRLYGNCDVDTRVFDFGDSYMFYGKFSDLQTGYSLTRPYRQRKGQATMRVKDPQRAEDIVFQIGASKAIRNVICNALDFFCDFAAEEAKKSIIDKVGQKLAYYRDKVAQRLVEMRIELKAVEAVRGRAFKDWLAPDVARTIAELQAIQDGMATIGETYLGDTPEEETTEPQREQSKTVDGALDQFAAEATASTAPAAGAAAEATAGAQAQTATAPAPESPLDIAYRRGQEARQAGMQRKAVPPEYRASDRNEEARAWQNGYDGGPKSLV